jgi:hypothetical protein
MKISPLSNTITPPLQIYSQKQRHDSKKEANMVLKTEETG